MAGAAKGNAKKIEADQKGKADARAERVKRRLSNIQKQEGKLKKEK